MLRSCVALKSSKLQTRVTLKRWCNPRTSPANNNNNEQCVLLSSAISRRCHPVSQQEKPLRADRRYTIIAAIAAAIVAAEVQKEFSWLSFLCLPYLADVLFTQSQRTGRCPKTSVISARRMDRDIRGRPISRSTLFKILRAQKEERKKSLLTKLAFELAFVGAWSTRGKQITTNFSREDRPGGAPNAWIYWAISQAPLLRSIIGRSVGAAPRNRPNTCGIGGGKDHSVQGCWISSYWPGRALVVAPGGHMARLATNHAPVGPVSKIRPRGASILDVPDYRQG